MAWEVIKTGKGENARKTPTASVGYGRITLSVSSCNLIENIKKYKHVELLHDPELDSCVGIRFLENNTGDSIEIKRKKQGEKEVGGIDITSKYHIQKAFGLVGTQKATTTYNVKKDGENILVLSPRKK